MKLTFYGATDTVTGSKHYLTSGNTRMLLDCGLFQGFKKLRLRNWSPLPFPVDKLTAVVLSHAHIDHSGYLPLLVRQGFEGPIYSTEATKALCEILLRDAAHLQEEEARIANLYGYSKHKPALPLYTVEDAEKALALFKTVDFNHPFLVGQDFRITFNRAGHILGAAWVSIESENLNIVFSGDLGRFYDPVMKPPAEIQKADYLILESTYGNTLHPKEDVKTQLETLINETAQKGGTILIPAFTVGRSQQILFYLHELRKENRIPLIPIYLDSPMAQAATLLWVKYHHLHKVPESICNDICQYVRFTHTLEESKTLDDDSEPKILISASGMATGGRVLHHIKSFAPYPKNVIVFAGFQVPGTRGEKMVHGDKFVKIQGEIVPIVAKVTNLKNLSAHADCEEILAWIKTLQKPPRKVFLVHGEPLALDSLRSKIKEQYGWPVWIPDYCEQVEI